MIGYLQQQQDPQIKEQKRTQFDIPHQFLCPISHSTMQNPYITMDGYTYEGSNIQKWFETNDKSPITGLRIDKKIVQNRALKEAIKFYKDLRHKMRVMYKQRQAKIKTEASQEIKKMYRIINQNFPELCTNQGFLCPTKTLHLCIKNIQMQKLLNQIKSLKTVKEKKTSISIQGSIQKKYNQAKTQNNCQSEISSSISITIQKIESFNKFGSGLNLQNLTLKKLNYLLLSCQEVKRIDFKKIKKEQFRTSQICFYEIQELTVLQLVERVRKISSIPDQYQINVWRTDISANSLYQVIKRSLFTSKCQYSNKVETVGRLVQDTSIKINELEMTQDQYLIFQNGKSNNMVFKKNGNICQYCYNQRIEKIKCICQKYTYCSIQCGLKDITFHSKQCNSLSLVKI